MYRFHVDRAPSAEAPHEEAPSMRGLETGPSCNCMVIFPVGQLLPEETYERARVNGSRSNAIRVIPMNATRRRLIEPSLAEPAAVQESRSGNPRGKGSAHPTATRASVVRL